MKKIAVLVIFAALMTVMVADAGASQLNVVNTTWTGTVGIRSMTCTNHTTPPFAFAVETISSVTVKITVQKGTLIAGTFTVVVGGVTYIMPFTGKLTDDGTVRLTTIDPGNGKADALITGRLSLVPYSIQGFFQSLNSGETGEFKVNRTP